MPDLATLILIAAVALAVWWKLRCIRRGCTIAPPSDDEAEKRRIGRRIGSRHL
ncbi:hypothetical protein [Oricola sp.]|uniref:hypothetical protein n=1 Tax=Oricola sp. TaxID=1979950 RepID=UPI0025E9BEF1|nr:hypothetical protein [Oricola sp.]MCI5074629.1 hypothetical protein [Oricola sp.]